MTRYVDDFLSQHPSPHIKGPKDKPLIIREKRAFVFGR